jgi:hypothetical protein
MVAAATLVVSSVVMGTSPGIANALEFDDVAAMADGLKSLATTLRELPTVEPLDQDLPFSEITPAELLGLNGLLGQFADKIDAFLASADPSTTVADLDDFLDDPDGANGADNDGSIGAAILDVTADITGTGAYGIDLMINLQHTGATTPVAITGPDGNGDGLPDSTVGASLDTDLQGKSAIRHRLQPQSPRR